MNRGQVLYYQSKLDEMLQPLPICATHGEWDSSIGGGVPVEHSKQMARLFNQLGIEYEFTIVPECGHTLGEGEGLKIIKWLCQQTRVKNPERVQLVAHTLRHNQLFWLSVDEFEAYGKPASADALCKGDALTINTENVKTLSVGPIEGRSAVRIALPGAHLSPVDLTKDTRTYTRSGDEWQFVSGSTAPKGRKRHGCSGPFSDLFFEPLYIVIWDGDQVLAFGDFDGSWRQIDKQSDELKPD